MESDKTDDRKQVVTYLKRIIFISAIVEIVLFLLALYSFLRRGWFVLLGVILLLAFGCVAVYILFWYSMLYMVKKANTVEIDDTSSGKRKSDSFRLTFGKREE